jgi:hypothetical protein
MNVARGPGEGPLTAAAARELADAVVLHGRARGDGQRVLGQERTFDTVVERLELERRRRLVRHAIAEVDLVADERIERSRARAGALAEIGADGHLEIDARRSRASGDGEDGQGECCDTAERHAGSLD